MGTRHVVLVVAWTITLAYYGLLKFVVFFTVACAVIFIGTVVVWGCFDAIRTRNDREKPRPTPNCDEELKRLRQMAGLEK